MWTKTDDGSILDDAGRVIYFSADRFVDDICIGGCCFICGAKPGSKVFNDEHILPDWLLREYSLHDKKITLPNGQGMRYGTYTVPCCDECNTLMGREIETPISAVVKSGLDDINDFAIAGGFIKLYVWAGLIFLKTHLKDRTMRVHQDARKGDAKISDEYDWSDLHHLHCMVRCFYTNCEIDPNAFGSFFSCPAAPAAEAFDFVDLNLAQTMHLRLGTTALFFVFNDSTAVIQGSRLRLERVEGPLNPLQCREVVTDFAFMNLSLKERPFYRTAINMKAKTCRIEAVIPKNFELEELDLKIRGQLMMRAVENVPKGMTFVGHTRESAFATIKAGTMTFLFDNNGAFIPSDAPATGTS